MKELVALYSRVSTHEQAIEGYSIGEQIERMKKYCAAMRWNVYKVYTDAGFSGSNTNRPGLQSLIKDVEAGKVTKVLVYKLDRLSRSQKDTLFLIEDSFLSNNIDFISMSENFDTSTPFGRAMIGVLAVFAQLEREQIKERMSLGKEARAKSGLFHGSSRVPIGYDYVDGKLVINDFEKMQVIQVFEQYAAGISPRRIAAELNASGLTHKYGNWKESAIRDLISRKTYLGFITHNGTSYKGEHEQIIDESLFDKVQELRAHKANEHKQMNRRPGKASSYLGGYLYCAHCGAKYAKASKSCNGYKYVYYSCNSRARSSALLVKDKTCKNKNWRMCDLDNIVFGEIEKLALDPDYIPAIKAAKEVDQRPKIIMDELQKLDNQLSRLMDLYSIGSMPLEIVQNKIHDINDRKTKLESDLERIEYETKEKMTQAETLTLAKSFGDILKRRNYDEIRTVISALIEKVVIDGEDITIYWKFA